MSAPVVLVLGNETGLEFATSVAQLAVEKHKAIVTLAVPGSPKVDQVRVFTTDPSSHDSIAAAFKDVLATHGRLDAVVTAYVPPTTATPGVPGVDQTAVKLTLDPTTRALKCALVHARRSGIKEVAVVAINGPDVIARTAAGAVVGMWRSLQPRFDALGAPTQLVFADVQSPLTVSTLTACIAETKSQVHIVTGDTVETVRADRGLPRGHQYNDMTERSHRGVGQSESLTRTLIWLKRARSKGVVAFLFLVLGVTVKTFGSRILSLLRISS